MTGRVSLTVAAAVALVLTAGGCGSGGGGPSLPAGVLAVDAGTPSGGTGSSWARAFNDLQSALDAASDGTEIWVAAGTYLPAARTDPDDARSAAFALKPGVAVYGGFSGAEESRDERDWLANVTVLSGDIGVADDASDNSYHVVIGADGAALDGFTVTGGQADGGGTDDHGAGAFIDGVDMAVRNCVFTGNIAGADYSWGGGVYCANSASPITDCVFTGNSAYRGGGLYISYGTAVVTGCEFTDNSVSSGGGVFVNRGSPTFINCLVAGNTAQHYGGGVQTATSTAALINCTIAANTAGQSGGGVYNHNEGPALTNCIVWGNAASVNGPGIYNLDSSPTVTYSCVQGGYTGAGNTSTDPLFAAAGDYRLQAESPAIDAGTNEPFEAGGDAEGVDTDLDGAPRIVEGPDGSGAVADQGAYEFQQAED